MFSEQRYVIFKGRVVGVNDPENRGRVKAIVPAVLKDQKSNWCEPLVRPIAPPKVKDVVYVQFLDGDISQPVYSIPAGVKRDIDNLEKELRDVIIAHAQSPHGN